MRRSRVSVSVPADSRCDCPTDAEYVRPLGSGGPSRRGARGAVRRLFLLARHYPVSQRKRRLRESIDFPERERALLESTRRRDQSDRASDVRLSLGPRHPHRPGGTSAVDVLPPGDRGPERRPSSAERRRHPLELGVAGRIHGEPRDRVADGGARSPARRLGHVVGQQRTGGLHRIPDRGGTTHLAGWRAVERAPRHRPRSAGPGGLAHRRAVDPGPTRVLGALQHLPGRRHLRHQRPLPRAQRRWDAMDHVSLAAPEPRRDSRIPRYRLSINLRGRPRSPGRPVLALGRELQRRGIHLACGDGIPQSDRCPGSGRAAARSGGDRSESPRPAAAGAGGHAYRALSGKVSAALSLRGPLSERSERRGRGNLTRCPVSRSMSLRGPLSERSERRGRGNPDLCRHPLLSTSPPVPLSLAGEGEPSLVIARPPERAVRAKGPWQSRSLSSSPAFYLTPCPSRERGNPALSLRGPLSEQCERRGRGNLTRCPVSRSLSLRGPLSEQSERRGRGNPDLKAPALRFSTRSLSSVSCLPSPASHLTPCPQPRAQRGESRCPYPLPCP